MYKVELVTDKQYDLVVWGVINTETSEVQSYWFERSKALETMRALNMQVRHA